MPKSLEDALAALAAVKDVGSELVDAVKESLATEKGKTEKAAALAATEKETGISEVKKKNKEAEGLRKFKTVAESFGYDPDEHDDLEAWGGEMKTLIDKGSQTGGDGGKGKESPEFKQMSKDMKLLTKRVDAAETSEKAAKDEAATLKTKTVNGRIRNKLLTSLNDKVYGASYVISDLINSGKVKVDEDDEEKIVFANGDGTLEYDEGVKQFLEKNKEIVKNTQSGGGGSGGSGGSGGDDKARTPEERTKELRKLEHSY